MNESQCPGPQRDSMYVVIPLTIIYSVIFLTGIIGNFSTCIVITRNKAMHTATNYYLFSLAISDLLLLIAGLPQEIYFFWSRYPYVFGNTFCFLRGLFSETSGNATVLTITAFTVERYLAICHPFLSHTMSKLSRAVKFIVVIWLVAIGFAVPQALPLKVVGEECPRCLLVGTVIKHGFEVSTAVFFVAPMTLIIVLYILIGLKLKASKMMKKRTNSDTRVPHRSSRKVVKMLVAVVVAFFICWAPFHVQRLYSIYSLNAPETQFYLKIYEVVTYISGILYYMSATINPILYNIMSVKFREAFKETFARCCGINHLHHGRPQRSYSVLSRSNMRGPDSITDSGSHDHTIQTNASTQKNNSSESFNGQGKRCKPSPLLRNCQNHEPRNDKNVSSVEMQNMANVSPLNSPGYLSVHMINNNPTKMNRFLQFFHCIAKKTFDDGKRLPSYYLTAIGEPNIIELEKTEDRNEGFQSTDNIHRSCISNSSLKDIESGAIEDELTAYMNEIKRRECCS